MCGGFFIWSVVTFQGGFADKMYALTQKTPHAENLCMGDVFINDKNYFFVVTLFEADQAP